MANQYKFDETTGKWLASGAVLSGVNSVNGLAGDVTYLPAGIVTTTTGDVLPPVYAKIYTGDTAPAVPKTGDIWIDSSYGTGTSNILRWRRIASGGETSLSGTDVNGQSLIYTPGYEELYINGILQYRGSDYVATTGTTITGISALASSDTIEVVAPSATQFGDYYTQAQVNVKFNQVGLSIIVPTTVTKGASGTASAAANGNVTFSGTEFVQLNGVFSSTYDNYRILINPVGNGLNGIQLSTTAGGPLTTASYSNSFVYVAYGSTAVGGLSNASTTYWVISNVDGNTGQFQTVEINNPAVVAKAKTGNFNANYVGIYGSWGVLYNGTTTAFDGFRYIPAGGTFSGTIRVYGYNNG